MVLGQRISKEEESGNSERQSVPTQSKSRAQEHQADVFGSEVVHGIVADPARVNAQSFQRLGEESLEYPYPSPFVVFWTYTHPPITEREAFAAGYDPWGPSGHPRYFSK